MTKMIFARSFFNRKVLVAAVLLAAAATNVAARPISSAADQVIDQLAQAVAAAQYDGFQLVNGMTGVIASNAPTAFGKVRLQRGYTYRFAARCDEDCRDLDMALVDDRGNVLKIDRDPDDTPSFELSASYTGDYYISLELAHCNARQCHAAVAIFAR